MKSAPTPPLDAGEAERRTLGVAAPESPSAGPGLFVWHRGLPRRRPDVALVLPAEPEIPARAQGPIPQPPEPIAAPEPVPAGGEAPTPHAPAATGSSAPGSAEPPVTLRPRPLLPEQVDELLRQYLSEPPAALRGRPAKASQAGPAEASQEDPAEAFQVWRLPTRRQILWSRLVANARSLRRPALVAIAIAAVAAGGANAYREYLALRPSESADRQPRPELPRPASTPLSAQADSARPTSVAPAAGLARLRAPAMTLGSPTRERAPAPPPKRSAAADPPKAQPAARATAPAPTAAPVASRSAPAAEPPRASASAAPPEEIRPKLTPVDVIPVIRSHRAAFDACVAEWHAREPQLDVNGVRVDLFITIDPSGAVTWSQLENPDIDRSTLGACLKGAGEKMTFPRFAGEALDVRVPLVLGQMPR